MYRQDGTFIQLPPFTVYIPSVRTGLIGCLNEAAPITLGPISEDSTQPVSKTITLCTEGSGSVNWTATWDQKWLQLPSSGQIQAPQQGNLTLTGSAKGLAPGSYTTTVVFSSRQSLTSVPLSVVLVVVKAGTSQTPTQTKGVECVSASPQSISFVNVADAAAVLSKSVTVNNCGDAGAWSASVSTSNGKQWLGISPSGNKLQSGGLQEVVITISSANLSPGKYTGQVTFQIGSSSANVQVTFTVWPPQPPPCISASPQSLTFVSIAGQSTPLSKAIKLINCGAAGQWSLSAVTDDGKDWVQFNPSSRALKEREVQQVNVSVSSAQLEKGTYTGKIIVSMGSSSVTVNITFIVEGSCLHTDYSSLLFKSTVGEGALQAPVTITNCGSTDSWYVSASTDDGTDRLTINKTYGQLPTNASQRIAVIVSGAQLHTGGTGVVDVKVILTVLQIRSTCTANPSKLTFTSTWGEPSPKAQDITLTNCGANDTWEESDYSDELFHVGPHFGTLDNNGSQVVSVSPSSYSPYPGTYTYTLTFTTDAGKTAHVDATWTVQPPPNSTCIQADPSSINFSDQNMNTSEALSFTNCRAMRGDVTVTGTTSDGKNWLIINSSDPMDGSVSYSSGYGPSISVRIDSTNLEPGPHKGSVTATIKTSQGSSSVTVGVTFTVPTPPPPPTPTPVPTATSGVTPTDTSGITPTATSTPGITPTDTSTPTSTPTPPLPTPTDTPTPSPTPTDTPTPSPTPTSSP